MLKIIKKLFIYILILKMFCENGFTIGINRITGNFIFKDVREKIKIGMSKDEVIQLIGTASFKGTFNENIWNYFYEKSHQIMFFNRKIIYRNIITMYFNKENKLAKISIKTEKNARNIPYDRLTQPMNYKKRLYNYGYLNDDSDE